MQHEPVSVLLNHSDKMELRSFALVTWVLIGMCYCDGGGGSLQQQQQQQQQQLQTDTTSYLTASPSSLLPSVVSTSPSAPALIRPSSPSAKPHLKVLSFTYSTKLPPSDEGDGQVDRVTRKVDVVSSSEEEEEEDGGTDDFVEEVSFEDLGSSREEREELLREIQKQLDLLEERTRGEEEEKSTTTPAWKYGFVPTARPEEVATLGPKPKPASKKRPRKKKSSKSRKKSPRVIQVSSHGEDRKRGNNNNLYSPTALPSYGFTATPRPLSHSPSPTPGSLQHFSPTPTPSYDESSVILNIGQGSTKAPKKRHSDKSALRKKSMKKKKASSSSAVKKNLNKKIYRYTIAPKLSKEQRAALIRSTTVSPVLLWSSSQEEEDDSSEEEATTVSAPISEEEEEDQSNVVTTTQYTPVYQGPWANFRRNPTPAPLPPAPTTVHSVDGEEEGEQEEPLVFSDLSSSSSSSEESWEEPESSSEEEEEVEEPETSGSSGSRATLDLKALPPLPAIRFLRPTTPSPAARPSTKALLLAALAEAEAKEAAAALRQSRRTKRKKSYVVRKPRPSSSLLNIVTEGDSKKPAKPGKYKIIPIVRHVAEISQERDRKYAYEYITGNGMTRREEGYLRDPDSEAPVQVQKGSYSYTDTDGQVYTIEYVADENGFRPTGPHIPSNLLVPPPSSAGGYGQR